ncbi:MmgE/PrpD family protein [Chloroflexota bacterium]
MATDTTGTLAGFCSAFNFRALPEPVVECAKKIVVDTLGAMLAASPAHYSGSGIITEFARAQGENPEATIIGRDFGTSSVTAALTNGTLAYYCDVEPHHTESIMHAAAVVIPSALAVGEKEGCDGRSFLTAVILGIDIACRVSIALNPVTLYERGFHPSSLAGCFGAAAAAGNIMKLDSRQFVNTIGLTSTQASGLLAWSSDDTENSRPFNPGIAARNGVTAALLSKMGFGGPLGVFDRKMKYNVFRAFSQNDDSTALTDRLGEHFYIDRLAIKLYSCCAFLHPGLDGLLDIMEKHDLAAEDIAGITLRFPKSGAAIIDNNPLKSHCAQYILPVAAVNKQVVIDDVLLDRRTEPAIARLCRQTRLLYDEELDKGYPEQYASIVEVTLKNGEIHSQRVDWPKGHPNNPLTRAEWEAKFRRLVAPIISPERSTEIIAMVNRLEEIANIAELAELLQVKS